MTTPIVFKGLNYNSGYAAIGSFIDGVFTVEGFISEYFIPKGTISKPGDTMSAQGNSRSIASYYFNLTATPYDNTDSIVFKYTISGASDGKSLVISNIPLSIGQKITYNESNFGDYSENLEDIPGILTGPSSLREGDDLKLTLSDSNQVTSALVTVETGGKVVDTFNLQSIISTFRAPAPPATGSYRLGYGIVDQNIKLTVNYTDFNGNKSTLTRDLFVQDVDRLGSMRFSGWVVSSTAASPDATVVTAGITDPDGAPASATYTFSRAGVVLQQGPSASLTAGYERAGQIIDVVADYIDGQGHRATVTGLTILGNPRSVGSIASTASLAPAIGGTVVAGQPGQPDRLAGTTGTDTVSYANSTSPVVIDLNAQLTWDGTANDTLVGIENAIGSRFADDVLGDAGSNVLDGGSGGADLINGLGGIDTVSHANSTSRVVIDLNAQLTWDGTDNDRLVSIENAIGSRFADDLLGDGGNNVLDGGAGGADLINGLDGVDTVSYASSLAGVVIDLNAQLTWDGTDNDRLRSIENAIGSRFDDTLINSYGDNVLTGGGGSDTFLFTPFNARDLVTDFQAGTGAGADVLAYKRGVFAGDDPLRNAVQSGADVVFSTIDYSTTGNGSITLLGVNLSDLTASNFRFS